MPVEITFAVRAMLDTVVFRRLRAAARRFAGANEGNIAILFGIAVIPIISFVGAAAVLGAVALVASLAPAWRATRVDPMVALRAE